MHDIEPHYNWRDRYIASEDAKSPFYRRAYDEFKYSQKIYNYYIHPQWDGFGSQTLYMKILWTDYEQGFTIFEMMGEWNDAIGNDIMFLKREIADEMASHGIHKYVVFCDNVLNFHSAEDDYYEEWYEDVRDEDGWICFLNLLEHVEEEMKESNLQQYLNFGPDFTLLNWRAIEPKMLCKAVEMMVEGEVPKFLR